MKSECVVVCFHIFGFILLMQGLFPFSSSTNNIANRSCFDSQESSYRHVILIVIDALRADYIFHRNNSYYLKSIEKLKEDGKALSVKLRTHTPTVTLPRLKAILTGTVPSFWDVLFNYNTSELELDNILFQYRRKYPDNKIVFYGDDTWMKLFPHSTFARSSPLQSFFVTDFKEIDLNVTAGVDLELDRMDNWNLLIIHYLGLDHIGHALGAFNSYVEEKLSEMDEVIERIFSHLSKDDLLIVTGDHGMLDQGGHGGSFDNERHVPLVFLSHGFEQTIEEEENEEYLQIDLTATLSALLEIPIPWNNLGILIEKVIKRFSYLNKPNSFKCLIDDNRRQLFNLLIEKKLSTSLDNLQEIRDQAMALSNEQNSTMLFLSLLLLCLSTIILSFSIEKSFLLSLIVLLICYLISGEIFISLGVSAISFCLIVIRMGNRMEMINSFRVDRKLSQRLLIFYQFFHLISLFSSSFIEEEHQTWYYFLLTYFLIVMFEEKSLKMFLMFILSRLIRSWNQTGNKWLNSPDLGDYFNAIENRPYLIIVHLISSMIFVYLLNQSRRDYFTYLLPLIVMIYRWNLLVRSSLIPLLLLLLRKRMLTVDVIFSLLYLLCRPHQSVIIVVHMIFYRYLNVDDARLAFLFSQFAYFHLGNSNSFVRIDISTGFFGIPMYLPVIHGALIYISTYGLSLNWLLKISVEERHRGSVGLTLINIFFSFCVLIQRNHLFVWTVFAPKVCYLCAQTSWNLFLFF